jgi:hypothetical protein
MTNVEAPDIKPEDQLTRKMRDQIAEFLSRLRRHSRTIDKAGLPKNS